MRASKIKFEFVMFLAYGSLNAILNLQLHSIRNSLILTTHLICRVIASVYVEGVCGEDVMLSRKLTEERLFLVMCNDPIDVCPNRRRSTLLRRL